MALAAAGVLAGLLMAEAGARILVRRSLSHVELGSSELYYHTDAAGVRRHIPGRTGYERMWDGSGKAEFRINSFGFRGRELPARKPPGTRRLLFLGDSITLGGRLPEEAVFVERVGQALEKASPGVFRTVNAGVGDIGLVEEEEILRGNGIAIEPDLVILCWYLNDGRPPVGFPEERIYRNPVLGALQGSLLLRRSRLAALSFDFLRKRLVSRALEDDGKSRRFDWIPGYNAGAWARSPEAFRELVRQARFDWGDAWDPKSRRAQLERLRRIRRFAEERGARFALVLLPLHAQVYAGFSDPFVDEPQSDIRRFCEGEGLPCLDLLPTLRKRAREKLFYDNCHYTPHGNGVVADAVLAFLLQKGLVNTP